MTEQELKEKIARIIAKHLCKNRYSHFQLYGDSANCYSRENFEECEVIADTVDALIAAGIGDVSEYERLKTELRSKVDYIHELWDVKEDYKHRAEVAERALRRKCESEADSTCPYDEKSERCKECSEKRLCSTEYATQCFYEKALQQAEKELQEERKDE